MSWELVELNNSYFMVTEWIYCAMRMEGERWEIKRRLGNL